LTIVPSYIFYYSLSNIGLGYQLTCNVSYVNGFITARTMLSQDVRLSVSLNVFTSRSHTILVFPH